MNTGQFFYLCAVYSKRLMQISAKALAKLLEGTLEGNPEVLVAKPSKIEEGGEGTITFLANAKYEPFLYKTTASVVLVHQDFVPAQPVRPTLIKVPNVYGALASLMDHFGHLINNGQQAVISPQAAVDAGAAVGQNVSIGPMAIVEKGAILADGVRIYAQAYIGPNVTIGQGSVVHSGARILKDCIIGQNCIIHANAVIGSDGFGFARLEDGSYKKIQQLGNVVLEDEVEVGANTVIDRASMGSTILRKGVKLDNLIQIAHNVEIGQNTVIAAQTGIAGSAKIGANCRIGGQVGIAGHITIADGTEIQAQSGISSKVEQPGARLFGSPAIDYRDFVKSFIIFKQLPKLENRLRTLEKGKPATED